MHEPTPTPPPAGKYSRPPFNQPPAPPAPPVQDHRWTIWDTLVVVVIAVASLILMVGIKIAGGE